MTQCYVLFPLHHLSCNVHLNITIIHFNLTRIAFQKPVLEYEKCKFFITLQKYLDKRSNKRYYVPNEKCNDQNKYTYESYTENGSHRLRAPAAA